jgi:hypothetical protein
MYKLFSVLSLAVLFSASTAYAQVPGVDVAVDANATTNTGVNANVNANANAQASSSQGAVRGNSQAQNAVSVKGKSDTASTTARGRAVADAHQSMVAAFVQTLLSAADRDRGIGAEVRAVAKSQGDSASTTAEALARVEGRSGVLDFLIGTDWKNAGTVRSYIAKSNADIQLLENAVSATTNASVKADLEAQIQVLKEEQGKLTEFVTKNETGFSLFGWFTKLFVKADV